MAPNRVDGSGIVSGSYDKNEGGVGFAKCENLLLDRFGDCTIFILVAEIAM